MNTKITHNLEGKIKKLKKEKPNESSVHYHYTCENRSITRIQFFKKKKNIEKNIFLLQKKKLRECTSSPEGGKMSWK